MKKYIYLIIVFFIGFLCFNLKTDALTSSSYASRNVCSKFELARAETNGNATKIACYNDYSSAKSAMDKSSDKNLFIFERSNNTTKIVDAKYALVDLSATGPDVTYFYTSKELKYAYTYMDTGSLYGGVDGVLLDVNYNTSIKVKVASLSSWIPKNTYEIVPLAWVKSSATYTISDTIKHNYVNKIQENYSGSKGSVIGPKPDNIAKGTYYSYDGHYFYKDRYKMIDDYKKGTYTNAVNKDAYYNYYMYLSNHSKTTYSALNIDEYIRNNMGVSKALYGDKSVDNSSRLYGQGTFFYNSQEKHGNNALLSFSHSRNETAHGRSSISITKNNGFGLNAVDSNPYEASNYFPTFASSIYEFGRVWVTDGYADPSDWRYFGPSFGDKLIGMNVKYASDPYWSEKMASLYYDFDKAHGLNDYNYYQLGVVTKASNAYLNSNGSSIAYKYPEAEDGVLIVGEVGNYYKVQSDKIINGTTITTTGNYNWNSYVYVLKSDIKKINSAKNGYKAPIDVTAYKDKDYSYDLYVRNATLKPKVAITNENIKYYYDSTLSKATGKTVLKDKWIMVYAEAFDKNGNTVAYLVTSDYKYDQKHWIPSGKIKFQTSDYGKVSVNISGAYTWVNSTAYEKANTIIGGLYTYSYVPVLSSTYSDGKTWYKVPVNLVGNDNSYGWTIAKDSEVSISLTKYDASEDNKRINTVVNSAPVITTSDTIVYVGSSFDKLNGVSATDKEDGNITSKIEVSGSVNTNIAGVYTLNYKVVDSKGLETTKTRKVTVIKNEDPIIEANDKEIKLGSSFDKLNGVKATDKEDGDITKKLEVTGEVDTTKTGEYKLTYKVVDSYKNETVKTITIKVVSEEEYLINHPKGEKEGQYYLDRLEEKDKLIYIKGYHAIKGIDNTLSEDIDYKIVFVNQNNNKEVEKSLTRITNKNDMTRPVYKTDNYDYTYSWFEGSIDISDISEGDYNAYIVSESNDYYAKTIISDKVLKSKIINYSNNKKYLTTRNNYKSNDIALEFIIRNEKIANKNSNVYNAYNQYRELKFIDDLLYIKGTAYSYGMNLSINTNLDRKIIFENIETFKKYSYDLGSINNGLYKVGTTLGDNLSKDKAWFEKSIDISNIPKGKYAIYISNKSNIEDYDELSEVLLRNMDSIILNKDNKKYSFNINTKLRYRVELIVE